MNKFYFVFCIVIFSLFAYVGEVSAQEVTYKYYITDTYPRSGETNIPTNLQGNMTGSSCTTSQESTICTMMIGLGVSQSNPTSGIGYPIIKEDTINGNTVTISSPNDPNIYVSYSGKQECGGCGAFYHSFSIKVVNAGYPHGIILMPNTTYTVTLKGGQGGLKVYYESSYIKYDAILESDYSWSFTTGNGTVPPRQPSPTPTSIINPTATPVPTQAASVQIINSNQQLPTNIPTATIKPTLRDQQVKTPVLSQPINKAIKKPTITSQVTLTPIPAAEKSNEKTKNNKITKSFIEVIQEFFGNLLKKFLGS